MADNANGKNGTADASKENQPNAQVIAQFIKDLSFENPSIERVLNLKTQQPELKVEVNVAAKRLNDGIFESAIEFSAKAEISEGVLYDIELVYAGLFKLENLPEEAIEPMLLVNSPMLLFPFVRRIVADITREGGFPPLFLDPIDFNHLYMTRKLQRGGDDAEKAIS